MGKIHGVSWLPNFYLKRHGVEIPWGKHHGRHSWGFMGAEFLPQTPWDRNTMGKTPWETFMVFHGCRISTSNAMGSKYHGENTMGNIHGVSWVPNFYLKICNLKIFPKFTGINTGVSVLTFV
jgi:hypothetical protein